MTLFDNAHLQLNTSDTPITPSNLFHHYIELPDGSSSLFNGSFCLDGYSYRALFAPCSDQNAQNLFFIRTFVYMHSREKYYTKRRNESSYLLSFTYEGKGVLEYEKKTYTLKKGEGFLIDCRKPHYYKSGASRWTHADLHFSGYLSDDFFELFAKNDYLKFQQPTDGNFQTQLEELVELYTGLTPYRELLISQKINSLLTLLLTSAPFYKKSVSRVPENLVYLLTYIQNYYHKHLTLDSLSDFSGISKPHLIRLFRKYVGCTPREYILRLQIENAKQLLESTALTIKQIGIMVGIEDANYFSRFFKSRAGLSPQDWRTAHRV